MAPELIKSGASSGYGMSIDIWSFGVFALEMGNGKPPNLGKKEYKVYA